MSLIARQAVQFWCKFGVHIALHLELSNQYQSLSVSSDCEYDSHRVHYASLAQRVPNH